MIKGRDLEAFCCGSGMHTASICSIVMPRCPNCGSEVWVLQTIGKEVEHGNKVSVNEVGRCGICHVMRSARNGALLLTCEGYLLVSRCWGIQCAGAYLYLRAASQGTCCVIVQGHEIFCHEGASHLSLNISRGWEDLWSCHPGDNECTHVQRKVKML